MSAGESFRQLRFFRVWFAVGIALVAVDVYLSLTTAAWDVDPRIADKRGHVIAYFGLMAWFSGLVTQRMFGIVALALMALGVVLELIQWWMGVRLPEPQDIVANAIGIGLGWGASAFGLATWSERVESWIAS